MFASPLDSVGPHKDREITRSGLGLVPFAAINIVGGLPMSKILLLSVSVHGNSPPMSSAEWPEVGGLRSPFLNNNTIRQFDNNAPLGTCKVAPISLASPLQRDLLLILAGSVVLLYIIIF